jgi:hypothetical protein
LVACWGSPLTQLGWATATVMEVAGAMALGYHVELNSFL